MAGGSTDRSNFYPEAAGWRRAAFLLLLLMTVVPDDEAADTLSRGQYLSGNGTIVSKGEVFELGFFRPGNATRFYVGIWYKKLTPQTVVWVANRGAPVSDASACQFKIDVDGGRLVLLNDSNKLVWSSSPSNESRSSSTRTTTTLAVLHDNGNLVLRRPNEATASIIWQSFDHPTDTWLPGAWLGRNNTTGESQKLVSWKSYDDPAPGRFSYALDSGSTPQFVLTWNGTQNYWASGPWNGRWFQNVPEMAQALMFYNFTFVNDGRQTSLHYATKLGITRQVVDWSTGQLQQIQWMPNSGKWLVFFSQPKHTCEVYSLCGSFGVCVEGSGYCRCLDGFEPATPGAWNSRDWSDGCRRRLPLRCGVINNGTTRTATAFTGIKADQFKVFPNMRLPANPRRIVDRSISREQDCRSACLEYFVDNNSGDCSCTAYSFENRVCSIWVGNLLNLQQLGDGDGGGGTLYLRVVEEEIPKKSGHRGINKAMIIVGLAVAGIAVIIVLSLIWLYRNRKAFRAMKRLGDGSLIMFSYRNLQSATKNFSEKLGAGGFGSVFRGVLPDATAIAVKKLALLQQGEKQFRAEVSTLSKVQHVNLVRLRGFCCSGPHRLLVYDFMPNGSLDRHLFGKSSEAALSWRMRYHIMLGVARGLAYLHADCKELVVHCDVKPENILLDANFNPKVADFGMSKLIGRNFSRTLTTMRGTRGYLAPEWLTGLPITPKVDVYSYGMMLLELVSGERNSCELRMGDADVYRPLWASTRVSESQASQVVDPTLEGNFDNEELERACRVACWCIQDHEDNRPSMRMIVQVLEGVVDLGIPPIPRSLLQLNEETKTITFFTECSSEIYNELPST